MNILLITDIHDDYHCAKDACYIEKPDLVLDCGDHEEMKNVAELIPHYFVPGNHEPRVVQLDGEGFPLPNRMSSSVIYSFNEGGFNVNFAGIGGNYSSRIGEKKVEARELEALKKLNPGELDILLLHESPFNLQKNNGSYNLAQSVIKEIKRIKPSFVFAGHTGKFGEKRFKVGSHLLRVINLADMAHGYGNLKRKGDSLEFRRIISAYRGEYVSP